MQPMQLLELPNFNPPGPKLKPPDRRGLHQELRARRKAQEADPFAFLGSASAFCFRDFEPQGLYGVLGLASHEVVEKRGFCACADEHMSA